eukprot:Gb_16763 [translate_table: standard]
MKWQVGVWALIPIHPRFWPQLGAERNSTRWLAGSECYGAWYFASPGSCYDCGPCGGEEKTQGGPDWWEHKEQQEERIRNSTIANQRKAIMVKMEVEMKKKGGVLTECEKLEKEVDVLIHSQGSPPGVAKKKKKEMLQKASSNIFVKELANELEGKPEKGMVWVAIMHSLDPYKDSKRGCNQQVKGFEEVKVKIDGLKEVPEVSPVQRHARIKDCVFILTGLDGSKKLVELEGCHVTIMFGGDQCSRKWENGKHGAKRFILPQGLTKGHLPLEEHIGASVCHRGLTRVMFHIPTMGRCHVLLLQATRCTFFTSILQDRSHSTARDHNPCSREPTVLRSHSTHSSFNGGLCFGLYVSEPLQVYILCKEFAITSHNALRHIARFDLQAPVLQCGWSSLPNLSCFRIFPGILLVNVPGFLETKNGAYIQGCGLCGGGQKAAWSGGCRNMHRGVGIRLSYSLIEELFFHLFSLLFVVAELPAGQTSAIVLALFGKQQA